MANGKGPPRRCWTTRRRRRSFRRQRLNLKEAADALRGAKKKKRKRRGTPAAPGRGRHAALALSEGLRKKVLDALFGAEEEFEYTSTTSPSERRIVRERPVPTAGASLPATGTRKT